MAIFEVLVEAKGTIEVEANNHDEAEGEALGLFNSRQLPLSYINATAILAQLTKVQE